VESFLIIVNPAAGRRAGPQRARKICKLLRAAGKRAEIALTAAPGDAYLQGVLCVLLRYRASPATLRGDFGERSGKFLMAAAGNTPSFGGNLRITPGAHVSDGLFQVCLVGDVSRLTVLAALGRLFRGTHLAHSAVEAFNTRFLEIETPLEREWTCADGESLCQTPCRLEVQPNALRVVVGSLGGNPSQGGGRR
jgi:diacylglycerol kinase (ATP)